MPTEKSGSEGVAESAPSVAEGTKRGQGAGGRAGAGKDVQVGGGGDRSRHAGLIGEADDAIGILVDEFVECADFRLS
jgi:hypothetical protein